MRSNENTQTPNVARIDGQRRPPPRRRGDPRVSARCRWQPELVLRPVHHALQVCVVDPRSAKRGLSHPQDLDAPLRLAAQRKINSYRQHYADNQNISFLPAIMTTSSRMHGEFLRLLFLQAHRETTAHFMFHCHWTAIATKPIGQRVLFQTHGILHGLEEQSRPRGGKSIGVTDQPQYPRL